MIEAVDPFIGTDASDLAPPRGLAAAWWSPKPMVGNTHPGATHPFGMVSACAYSGAYPTGYGCYGKSTEGMPTRIHDQLEASGFTHFQQSGTGAIRKYYNYYRVTPMLGPLDSLGTRWRLEAEGAEPGYYTARLDSGIHAELTVGPRSAVHRYTFPRHRDARLVVDVSQGGLGIEHGRTVPTRAQLESVAPGVARGEIVVEGVPLAVHIECDTPRWRQMLWYDRRLMAGSTRLDFDAIRLTTLRPFGLILIGPTEAGQSVELRLGFSLRGAEQAEANLVRDCGPSSPSFDARRSATSNGWRNHLGRIRVEGGSASQRTVYATAAYHSMIKPCFAADESPFWPSAGPFVFDICTMWDIYKTQLPLLTTVVPERAAELVEALLTVAEIEGNLPIGYRMARGADRFSRQGSALAHTFLADVCRLGMADVGPFGTIDWDNALVHMHGDLLRNHGEDYVEHRPVHPVSHTLDLAYAYHCTAQVARRVDDPVLAGRLDALAEGWIDAFEPTDGLLVSSTFYEGHRWNYSFRLLHDMAARIALAGGPEAFVGLLDRFFGFGADPVKQLGEPPFGSEVAAGYALHRFQGLNNEPDMEAPWAYHYAGRPDRTAEVVQAVVANQFGDGRGGLPGNDDSGGLSSWYVWASLGLFPVAGQDVFLIGAPFFPRADLLLGDHRLALEVAGRGIGPDATDPDAPTRFVKGVRLDGRRLDRSWVSGLELHRARHLEIVLGEQRTSWGGEPPPSISDPSPNTGGAEP